MPVYGLLITNFFGESCPRFSCNKLLPIGGIHKVPVQRTWWSVIQKNLIRIYFESHYLISTCHCVISSRDLVKPKNDQHLMVNQPKITIGYTERWSQGDFPSLLSKNWPKTERWRQGEYPRVRISASEDIRVYEISRSGTYITHF